jgi:hypothetical protein
MPTADKLHLQPDTGNFKLIGDSIYYGQVEREVNGNLDVESAQSLVKCLLIGGLTCPRFGEWSRASGSDNLPVATRKD